MKKRLDLELLDRGLVRTRSRASDLIKSGAVLVNGVRQSKGGFLVDAEDEVMISTAQPAFEVALHSVGRGAVKLDFALVHWNIPVTGLCIDVGASTGGFTEILLKNGAEHVIAIDVGRDQLDRSLREDERVISLEGLDIRTIVSKEDLAAKVRLHFDKSGNSFQKADELRKCEAQILLGASVITCDVSFISLTKVLSSIQTLGGAECHFVFLIKPQFEMDERKKRKKGIVNSAKDREEAVKKVMDFASGLGLINVGLAESPIKGGDGNIEYLAYFIHSGSRS